MIAMKIPQIPFVRIMNKELNAFSGIMVYK